MTTTDMNTNAQFSTLFEAAKVRLGRSQPRWLVLLTGGVALAVLVKLAIVVAQVYNIVQTMYAAGLT
jgi:hypothetical protein